MNLYEVINGWTGESYVRVYVVAETEGRALELARAQFQAVLDDPAYYTPLQVETLCPLPDGEMVTIPSDRGWDMRSEDA